MEHPILTRIRREGFAPLGWFEPKPDDNIPSHVRQVILIGNAGADMFRKFMRDSSPSDSLDVWSKGRIDPLADDLGATVVYPFDKPPQPFLTWARRGGAGYVSPLGLNIHPTFGLWHAYRAALLFPVAFDFGQQSKGSHPCETCVDKPCLSACPVSAFDGTSYDVKSCGQYLHTDMGENCMADGCQARRACPIGTAYTYAKPQLQFHMKAFKAARAKD